ncbi:hypothetical protein [Streptomyces glomeratus]|uniref:hypothetical protein n=1 Tax=Streptomyces glomeratus TaxID=284452 RepID=UPI001F43ACA8|nr:hypothetical protein [Streptomyces glomeratus]MCF1509699.1 hypothetical protein [Streptomyces glomeratus]
MIAVAVLLLPVLGLVLFAMDRFEDRLFGRPPAARHARGRHLRLIGGTSVEVRRAGERSGTGRPEPGRSAAGRRAAEPRERHADVA